MANSVTVAGLVKDMGGLKESQVAFRKNAAETANALLNIAGVNTLTGEPMDKDDERPAYIHQAFPCMLYHAEKGELVVDDESELKDALERGYRKKPYPKPQIEVLSPEVEKKALMDQNRQLQAQLSVMMEKQAQLAERLEQMEAGKKSK